MSKCRKNNRIPLSAMVQSVPEAGETERPTGRSISCGVSDAPTYSLSLALSPRNSLRRRVFSGARRYRDTPTPSLTSWYYFNCVACLCCCFFFFGGGPPPFGVCCPVHSGHRTQEWLDPLLQPLHSPWGMRGLPQRNRRNLHVWMNKRTEREAIAAEMEEKTLSAGAARKSFWTSRLLLLVKRFFFNK